MVQIITDSAADFEPLDLKNKNIICIPMHISFGDKEFKENENLSKNEFYELLENADTFPKTSQPSPYEFEECLQKFKEAGDECIIITISSALSGTYQNAFLTKQMLDYVNCYVVDSLNATGGERMLVEEAVRLRDTGMSASDILKQLEELKEKIMLIACVDTLEYLYKGGRISKVAYTVGSAVNIKPIIKLSDEGKVKVVSKTLSIKQGIKAICEKLSNITIEKNYPIYIIYSHNRKNADILADKLRKAGHEISDENIFDIGMTIGSHIGTNACGYVCVKEY